MSRLVGQQRDELVQIQQAVPVHIHLQQNVFPDYVLNGYISQNAFQFVLGHEPVLVHVEVLKGFLHLLDRLLLLLLQRNHTELVNVDLSRLVDVNFLENLVHNFLRLNGIVVYLVVSQD